MQGGCTAIAEVAREVRLLKVKAMDKDACIKSRWNVDGYDWEIHFHPSVACLDKKWAHMKLLIFLREPRTSSVKAKLSCQLVDPTGKLLPIGEKSVVQVFSRPHQQSPELSVACVTSLKTLGYLKDDCLTVESTITVLKELPVPVIPDPPVVEVPVPVPASDLHQHLAELLRKETATDVTFDVSGESLAALKLILAARPPVFMTEFFGRMKEASSGRVEVADMEPAAFKAMIQFIYTDTVPELDRQKEAAMAMHLLAAADRYGLDRLKLICEGRLSGGIDVDTAAATLALAEQHGCSLLKAKCVEFIISTPAFLDAVMATEGYKHLEVSCPMVLRDLIKAARGCKKPKTEA